MVQEQCLTEVASVRAQCLTAYTWLYCCFKAFLDDTGAVPDGGGDARAVPERG